MKKKVFGLLIIFIVLASNYSFANTISGNGYLIDLPETYKKISDGNYASSNGMTVRIERYPINGDVSQVYGKKFMKTFEDYLNNELLSNARQEYKNQLSQNKNSYSSNKNINSAEEAINLKIEKKEVTKVTKNKYKCAHFLVKVSEIGKDTTMNIYIIPTSDKRNISNERVFLLLCIGEDINPTEMNDIRNSFSITNYQKPSTVDYLINRYGFSVFYYGAILIPIIGYFMYRKEQRKK